MKKLPRTIPLETLRVEDIIRHRAFELYEKRGKQQGNELDDCLQAEKEVLEAEAKEVAAHVGM